MRLALKRTGQLLGRAASEFFDDGCPQRAAAISYYALFSLFPLAILAVAAIGVVVDDQAARDRVVNTVLEQLPLEESQGRREIEALLVEATTRGGAFSIFGVLGLLFAASGVMGAIRHALNAAFEVEDARPPLRGKAIDLLLVVGFGVLVIASFIVTLTFRLTDEVTDLFGSAGAALDVVIEQVGRFAPALLAFVTFAVLLKVAPARHTRVRDVWPGVLIATAGYELAKTGFAFYLEHFARYGTVYASLGTAVAFMAFVFVAANVALFGAEAASVWPRVRAGELDDDDSADDRPLRARVASAVKGLVVQQRP